MQILDSRTIVTVMVLACFLMGAGLLAVSRLYRKEVPEAGMWAWGTLLQGVGWLFFATLRGTIPDVISIMAGQVFLQGGVALYLLALRDFLNLPRRYAAALIILGATMAALFEVTVISPDYTARQVVIAVARSLFAFWSASLLWRSVDRPRSHTYTAVLFALCGVLLVMRAVIFLALPDLASQAPLESHPLTQLTFMAYFVFAVALPFGFVLMCSERHLEQHNRAEAVLRDAASIDPLTQLANRHCVTEHLRTLAERQTRRATDLFAVLFVDLDSFKQVNDSFGHEAGDRVLVETANRLSHTLRHGEATSSSLAGRFGGDEFVLVLAGLQHASDAEAVAQRLLQAMARPFDVGGQLLSIRCSIGVCTSASGADGPMLMEDLLRDADTAMYHAKKGGKGTYAVCDDAMRRGARVARASGLRKAI